MRTSAIVPVRDRQRLVVEAVASIACQHRPVDEVIVVDDGSADGSGEAVRVRFPGVAVVRTPGLGPGGARNAGALRARGEVLFFLDSDDLWLPQHTERLLTALARGFAAAYAVTRTEDLLAGGAFCIPEPGTAREGDLFAALRRWCCLVPSAFAVRREAFWQAGGFGDGGLGEDWEFFCRLARDQPFGLAGPQPTVIRRLHPGSICARADKERLVALLDRLAPYDPGYFAALRRWTAAQPCFASVQEWYERFTAAFASFPEDPS